MKVIYFFLFLFIMTAGYSQSKLPLAISFLPKTGFLIAHRPYMSHLVKDRNTAFELEFSQQDNSRNFTSNDYRFPSRGFSLHFQDYGYKNVLGRSFSVLQFTKFNLIQHKKFGFLDFRIGSGIGYITKKYDAQTNPKNNTIGSYWNAFINFQVGYEKYFNHLLVGAGLEMSHFSNAAITMPNLGLNTPMCYFKIGYALNTRDIFSVDTNPVIAILPRYSNNFQFHLIGSVKQNLPGNNPSEYLQVIALQTSYRKYINFKWDLEAGIDLIYNQANRVKYDGVVYSFGETVQAGIFIGAATNFYKSQIFFGIGGYVYNKINPAGWIYNRIGYRYAITPHLSALAAIKANIGIADYLEIGIGYRL
ncbi:MAG: acyloxyacyl hydrolase [Crocinitomicaceae bacterium]|nr:acyloxyacyl hydrolase [Crocinitomicaceae bacterium]